MEYHFITYLHCSVMNRHFSHHFSSKTINNPEYDIMWVASAAWHGGFFRALQVS